MGEAKTGGAYFKKGGTPGKPRHNLSSHAGLQKSLWGFSPVLVSGYNRFQQYKKP